MGSGVLVESLKNKHEAAETDISVGPTSRTLVRMQRTRERCYVPSQCCSYCPITQLREIGTPTLHCTNCRFGLQSEDWAIDPLGHGITPTTRPQVAGPEESSQLLCYCATIWPEAESEFGIHSRHDREFASFIIMILEVCLRANLLPYQGGWNNHIRKTTKPPKLVLGPLIDGE